MQQAQAHAEDVRLDAESRLSCKGSALVRFENLKWSEYIKRDPTKRIPDPGNVERLKRIFQKEGCRQLNVTHHIPAIIDQHRLDAALLDAKRKGSWSSDCLPSHYATISTQDGYPELDFPGGIECLHGRHRIEAGKTSLDPSEKWWIVDLYLSGISYEFDTLLVEEYANEEKPCDGKICRKIREYETLPGNSNISPKICVSLQMRWWVRLNSSREGKLRSLYKIPSLHAEFNALHRFPGLFDAGMKVTTLNKILQTKCYEEMGHYLEHIRLVWEGFLEGITEGHQRIDMASVKAVELWAPGVSTLDAQKLRGNVLGGAIFSGFSDQERITIWGNILAFKGIIPSLSKFFEDVKFLEACVDSLKWLVKVPSGNTLFEALSHSYNSKRKSQQIQTTETTFQSEVASETGCKLLGYLVLVAFVMRYNPDLPKAPSGKKLKIKPKAKLDLDVLHRLAALAEQQGFESPEIDELKGHTNPLLASDTQESVPLHVTTGVGESIKHRCGIPNSGTFEKDMKFLFLHNLCEEKNEVGDGITSYFVLKSWFTAFFKPSRLTKLVSSMEGSSPLPPQAHHQQVYEADVDMTDQPITEVYDMQGVDVDEQMRMQRRMSWYAQKENRRLETGQEMQLYSEELFVPQEVTAQDQPAETEVIIIRFVEREGNEIDMLNPLQEHAGVVQEVIVDRGDPTSLVEQHVRDFLHNGKRTCDRYKRIIPEEECYSVATREENANTLFLIPAIEFQEVQEAEWQVSERPEMKDQVTEVLESRKISRHQRDEDEDEDNDLLNQEMGNAANSSILDRSTIVIYLKKRVENSKDVSMPAKHWEWVDYPLLEVPADDPGDMVGHRMRSYLKRNLTPHDRNLRRLAIEECYHVARNDPEHTLYMIKPSSVPEGEGTAELALPSNLPSTRPVPLDLFQSQEKNNGGKENTNPRFQEKTGLEISTFVAPTNVPISPRTRPLLISRIPSPPIPETRPARLLEFHPLSQPPPPKKLVKSGAEAHRDKIGRGPDNRGNGKREQNRVGMSFEEGEVEERFIEIRKKAPEVMRIMPEDSDMIM